MTNCTNCDQVNDLWDENQKLKKAYDEVCVERDKLKEENKSLYRACNILLAEQRADYNDGLPKVEGELLTENDVF